MCRQRTDVDGVRGRAEHARDGGLDAVEGLRGRPHTHRPVLVRRRDRVLRLQVEVALRRAVVPAHRIEPASVKQ